MCRAARKSYLCTYTPLFDFHQFGFWDFLVYVICNSYHLMRRRRVFQIRFRRLQRLVCTKIPKEPAKEVTIFRAGRPAVATVLLLTD